MAVTAKITVSGKTPQGTQTLLTFMPDYQDGRNKEWAEATPSLSLSMNVLNSVAERFDVGQAWTLTFTPSEEE